MASFKDATGRSWLVNLDAPTIRTIRKELDGLDLADIDGSGISRIERDPVLLFDVLWLICRNQAQQEQLTDDNFGRLLIGDVIADATAAMLESIADFFPKQKRDLIRTIGEKNKRLRELGMAKAMAAINDPELEAQILADVEAQIDADLRKSLMRLRSATSSRDSAESTPAA